VKRKKPVPHPDWPYTCDPWCKVHWRWDFATETHKPYPVDINIMTPNGWANVVVFIGPPAYNPRKPRPDQWEQMRMTCPHDQLDLTCNTCQRHTFRPLDLA
jgi:hypothetical protein